jgi:RNA polymerase sigma factor (sigma-70 family)
MIRRAFRRAFDDGEVEDIYSNAWLGTLRALAHRHEALSDEEIRKYVLAAVANHASKELRRRRRRPTAPLDTVGAVADEGLPPDERAAKLEHSRLTRDLLSSLPPRRRAVILLRYGWGLEPRQVCGLIKGLSPRAYRKEITRGIDELTEKMRRVESGDWCTDREPILKAYAAGLANLDQQRQAEQHLSHCRRCGEFVGKLHGHLHDAGSSIAFPAAADAIDDGRLGFAERLGDALNTAREAAVHALGARGGDGASDAAQALSGSNAARGAGAAGTGALAKLAGIGTAGKLATLCLGGGAAATACLAAGVLPAGLPGLNDGATRVASERPVHAQPDSASHRIANTVESEPGPGSVAAPENDPPTVPPVDSDPSVEPVSELPPPIEPSAPAPQQEFGVASAAPTSSGAATSSSAGGSASRREFGP